MLFEDKVITVACNTEAKAETLLIFLHQMGYKWASIDSIVEKGKVITKYDLFSKKTIYFLYPDKCLKIGSIKDSHFEHYEFENFMALFVISEEQKAKCSNKDCGECSLTYEMCQYLTKER